MVPQSLEPVPAFALVCDLHISGLSLFNATVREFDWVVIINQDSPPSRRLDSFRGPEVTM